VGLATHPWPGNVRELRNLCERLVILHGGDTVTAEALPLPDAPAAPDQPVMALPEGGLDWERLEQSLIGQALDRAGGNRSRAARLLGMSRDRFLYRLRRMKGGG